MVQPGISPASKVRLSISLVAAPVEDLCDMVVAERLFPPKEPEIMASVRISVVSPSSAYGTLAMPALHAPDTCRTENWEILYLTSYLRYDDDEAVRCYSTVQT